MLLERLQVKVTVGRVPTGFHKYGPERYPNLRPCRGVLACPCNMLQDASQHAILSGQSPFVIIQCHFNDQLGGIFSPKQGHTSKVQGCRVGGGVVVVPQYTIHEGPAVVFVEGAQGGQTILQRLITLYDMIAHMKLTSRSVKGNTAVSSQLALSPPPT